MEIFQVALSVVYIKLNGERLHGERIAHFVTSTARRAIDLVK